MGSCMGQRSRCRGGTWRRLTERQFRSIARRFGRHTPEHFSWSSGLVGGNMGSSGAFSQAGLANDELHHTSVSGHQVEGYVDQAGRPVSSVVSIERQTYRGNENAYLGDGCPFFDSASRTCRGSYPPRAVPCGIGDTVRLFSGSRSVDTA